MATCTRATDVDTKDTLKYQVSVIQAMMDVFEECLAPSEIIHFIGLTEVQKEIITGKDRPEAARLLLKEVLSKPEEHVSLFVAALRHSGFERFIDILDNRPVDKDLKRAAEKYELLLRMLEGDLINRIIPSDIVDGLEPILGVRDREKVLAMENRMGSTPACQELFFCMKRKTTNWPLKFLEVLHENMPELPAKIDPAFENGVGSAGLTSGSTTDTEQTGVKEMCSADAQSAPADHSDEDDYLEALSDEEKQEYEDLEKDVTSINNGRNPKLNMRKYQLELAEKALQGENSTVYAPTGSGKTRVAIYVAKNILDSTDEVDRRKVLFLEPTVALVDQTHKAVHHYLGKEYQVAKVRGRDEQSVSLHALLPVNDVIVMTPKILDNHLENGRIKSVSGMCRLLILDECHHTRKEEVYNKVMLRYLKEKKSGAKDLPQVLGLTATLGVEGAMEEREAAMNILKLCANLDTSDIVKVEKHDEELKRLVAVPEEETILLPNNKHSPSHKVIEAAMIRVEQYLLQFHVLEDDGVNTETAKARDQVERSSATYTQWTVFLKNAAAIVNAHGDPTKKELVRNLIVVADNLYVRIVKPSKKYNVALTFVEYVRVKDVVTYLKGGLISSRLGNQCTLLELQLQEILREVIGDLSDHEKKRKENKENENPRLNKLADTLQDLIENTEGESRVIIFASTRAICEALVKWLNEDEHLPEVLKDLGAAVFTGLNASGQEGGMTPAQQDIVIANFRDGTIKLIVATSVAHEGLDIPQCNIVISYDHVGSQVTTIQTRGRSRKVGGKALLLASDKNKVKQEENLYKVHIMNKAIRRIRDMAHSEVQKSIAMFQKEVVDTDEVKILNRQLNALKMTGKDFTLLCIRCRQVCTIGSMMRLIDNKHRVTIDKDVRDNKIKISYFSDPKKMDDWSIDGSVRCKQCNQPWGTWLTYQKVTYPSLSIANFTLESTDVEKPQSFKQWKKCPYIIKPLTTADTLKYLGSDDGEEADLVYSRCARNKSE